MKAKKYSVWISILRLLAGAHDRRVEQERRAFVVAGKMRFRSSRFLRESMTSNRLSLENDSQQVLAVKLPHHAYHLSDRHYRSLESALGVLSEMMRRMPSRKALWQT